MSFNNYNCLRDDGANHDLWQEVVQLLSLTSSGMITVQHVHLQLDSRLLASPFEDWLKFWHDWADTAAGTANRNRSVRCTDVHVRALEYFTATAQSLRMWRDIYFGIAAGTSGTSRA